MYGPHCAAGRLAYKVNLAHSGVVTDRALEADKPYIHPLPLPFSEGPGHLSAALFQRRLSFGRRNETPSEPISVSDGHRSVGNGVRVAREADLSYIVSGKEGKYASGRFRKPQGSHANCLAGILGRNSSRDALRVLTNAL